MKIKTISEYLLIDIDEPHRRDIVENVLLQGRQQFILTETVPSRSQALLQAFFWNKSKQGFQHWHELFLYFVQIDGMNALDQEFFNRRIEAHKKQRGQA